MKFHKGILFSISFVVVLFSSLSVKTDVVQAASPCYIYQAPGVSPMSINLTTNSGQSQTVVIPKQDPPSILQAMSFKAADATCGLWYPALPAYEKLAERFLTQNGTITFAKSPVQLSLPNTLYMWNWNEYFGQLPSFSYNGLSDIGLGTASVQNEISNEDSIISYIASTGRLDTKIGSANQNEPVANDYAYLNSSGRQGSYNYTETVSTPASNCQVLTQGGGTHVIFQRDPTYYPSVSDAILQALAMRDQLLTEKPYSDNPSQYSFYIDLKKQPSNPYNIDHTYAPASGSPSSCYSHGNTYLWLVPAPTMASITGTGKQYQIGGTGFSSRGNTVQFTNTLNTSLVYTLPAIDSNGSNITLTIPDTIPDGQYTVNVRANTSLYGNALATTISTSVHKSDPTNLVAMDSPSQNSQIDLTWSNTSLTSLSGYVLERSTSKTDGFVVIKSDIPAGSTHYTYDMKGVFDSVYYYKNEGNEIYFRIRSKYTDGTYSKYSNTAGTFISGAIELSLIPNHEDTSIKIVLNAQYLDTSKYTTIAYMCNPSNGCDTNYIKEAPEKRQYISVNSNLKPNTKYRFCIRGYSSSNDVYLDCQEITTSISKIYTKALIYLNYDISSTDRVLIDQYINNVKKNNSTIDFEVYAPGKKITSDDLIEKLRDTYANNNLKYVVMIGFDLPIDSDKDLEYDTHKYKILSDAGNPKYTKDFLYSPGSEITLAAIHPKDESEMQSYFQRLNQFYAGSFHYSKRILFADAMIPSEKGLTVSQIPNRYKANDIDYVTGITNYFNPDQSDAIKWQTSFGLDLSKSHEIIYINAHGDHTFHYPCKTGGNVGNDLACISSYFINNNKPNAEFILAISCNIGSFMVPGSLLNSYVFSGNSLSAIGAENLLVDVNHELATSFINGIAVGDRIGDLVGSTGLIIIGDPFLRLGVPVFTNPAPILNTIVPNSGSEQNTFKVFGSGFTSTENSAKLTLVTSTASAEASFLFANVSSFFSVIWNFFTNLIPWAHGQTVSSDEPIIIDRLASADGTSLTFTVPPEVPDGTYQVSVAAFDSPWVDATHTIEVSGHGAIGYVLQATPSYSCPSGATLNGSSCTIPSSTTVIATSTVQATAARTCPADVIDITGTHSYVLQSDNTCKRLGWNITNAAITYSATATYSCATGYTLQSNNTCYKASYTTTTPAQTVAASVSYNCSGFPSGTSYRGSDHTCNNAYGSHPANTVYSCSSGTLSGNMCNIPSSSVTTPSSTVASSVAYSCSAGSALSGTSCRTATTTTIIVASTASSSVAYSCPAGTLLGSTCTIPAVITTTPASTIPATIQSYVCPLGYTLNSTSCNPHMIPATVSSVAGGSDDKGKVFLTWNNDNAPNLSGVSIERSNSSTGTFSTIGSTVATSTQYVDTGLPSSQTFYYRLRMLFNNGKYGPYSAVASSTTFAMPLTLTASSTISRISFVWLTTLPNDTTYTLIQTVPSTTTLASGVTAHSFEIAAVPPGTTYCAYVTASSTNGMLTSDPVCIMTLTPPLQAPTLTISDITMWSMTFNWDVAGQNITRYSLIETAASQDVDGNPIPASSILKSGTGNLSSYRPSNFNKDTRYCAVLAVTDASGKSATSTEACATTANTGGGGGYTASPGVAPSNTPQVTDPGTGGDGHDPRDYSAP